LSPLANFKYDEIPRPTERRYVPKPNIYIKSGVSGQPMTMIKPMLASYIIVCSYATMLLYPVIV
jgi:hypothetical protein